MRENNLPFHKDIVWYVVRRVEDLKRPLENKWGWHWAISQSGDDNFPVSTKCSTINSVGPIVFCTLNLSQPLLVVACLLFLICIRKGLTRQFIAYDVSPHVWGTLYINWHVITGEIWKTDEVV